MADPPPFDPNKPFTSSDIPAFDPSKPFESSDPAPPQQYEPSILPITRVPKGTGNLSPLGMDSHSIVIPKALKDIYDTMIEGGEAARGHRTMAQMEQIAPQAAMLAIGAGGPGAAAAEAAPRVAGDLAAGTVAVAKPTAAAIVDAVKAVPKIPPITPAQVKAAAKDAYKVVDNSSVRISPESFQNFADQMPSEIEAFDKDLPELTPKSAAVVKRLQNIANEEDSLKFSKMERLRQTINKAASKTNDGHDALVLGEITDKLDNYIQQLPEDHLDFGEKADLDAARNSAKDARALWSQKAKMSRFEEIRNIAESQDDPDLYIRQRVRSITRNPNLMNQYTADQKSLIEKIAKQGTLGQLGRVAPHLTPAGMVKGAIYGSAAASPLGPVLPAMMAGASTAAFHGAHMLRRARLQNLMDSVAMGGESPPSYLERFQAERAARRMNNPTTDAEP